MTKLSNFPKGFYWGAATSAHQIEGSNHNDWSEWELKNAKVKAQIAKNNPLKGGWPEFILGGYPNPLQEENYISGRACDHYNRYEEDFDIAKSLGHNAHRFSIEWSRIEPEEGKFDEKEIEHYRKVIQALKKRGIEPFVTLWHWPTPEWFNQKNDFNFKKFSKYYTRYVEKVAFSLKNEVKFWITLNEPEIFSANSYLKGIWPPQRKNIINYLSVFKNLTKAHIFAFAIIKKIDFEAQVGIAKNNIYFEAHKNRIVNRLLKFFIDWWWNFYFLNKIKNYQDFIGLNHYFHNRIDYGFNKNENKKISDMGWELMPEALYHVLKDLKKYNKPVYITENGLADAKDKNRSWFIKESVRTVQGAIDEGIDVRGYFYWSLLDNFEWDKGFWPRFGLVEVDYKTMKRKIRPSAWEYKKIIEVNTLSS